MSSKAGLLRFPNDLVPVTKSRDRWLLSRTLDEKFGIGSLSLLRHHPIMLGGAMNRMRVLLCPTICTRHGPTPRRGGCDNSPFILRISRRTRQSS